MVEPAPRDERIEQVRRAAVHVFADHGFRGTSMAMLAAAVGVSRPALYQWFDNREDVFRSAMELLLNETSEAAISALHDADDLVGALSGWLRNGFADGYSRVASTPHGAELLEAHFEFSADVAEVADERMRQGLASYLHARPGATPSGVDAALQLLTLSPLGLKADQPSPAVYGERLERLAAAVAALLEG